MEKKHFHTFNMHITFLILGNYFDSILLELLQIFIITKYSET